MAYKENTGDNMIWNKLAERYDQLWVQKYSLHPTRVQVMKRLDSMIADSLIDIGCGTGQLLSQISQAHPHMNLTGIDKAEGMIRKCREKKIPGQFICGDINEMEKGTQRFDAAICCHSFPYYDNKPKIIDNIHEMLNESGKAIFIQASQNSLYDKIALWMVERTAEKAEYLSRDEFCKMFEKRFVIEESFTIRERWFMPSICGFVMRRI
jgi:ubiquinone/menaquinone biosynthesis C-methylase UbiE